MRLLICSISMLLFADTASAAPAVHCDMQGLSQSAHLHAPADGKMIAGFGPRRHPLLGYVKMHPGQDYKGSGSDTVRALESASVKFAGVLPEYGKTIVLDHGGGFESMYAHLSEVSVVTGSCVARDQTIGLEGATGLSSGIHLHFEIRHDGIAVDPLPFVKSQS